MKNWSWHRLFFLRLTGVAEAPRVIPYGPPSGPPVQPPQGLDAYLRLPGAYFPPTIWEA